MEKCLQITLELSYKSFLKTVGLKKITGPLKLVSNRKKILGENEIRKKDLEKIFTKKALKNNGNQEIIEGSIY